MLSNNQPRPFAESRLLQDLLGEYGKEAAKLRIGPVVWNVCFQQAPKQIPIPYGCMQALESQCRDNQTFGLQLRHYVHLHRGALTARCRTHASILL